MDPFEFRLKSLSLRKPSADFGEPGTLAEALRLVNRRQSLMQRTKDMSWRIKSVALVGLAAGLAAIYLAVLGSPGGSVAFAQIVEKLRAAETLTYDCVTKSVSDGKVLGNSQNWYMTPGHMRTEMASDDGERGFVVFDIPAGKILMVDSKRKTARTSTLKGGEGDDIAAKAIEEVRTLSAKDARSLGQREIDGVRAKGYEVNRDSETTTVWADAATARPIRIEITEKKFPSRATVEVWTNIKLDEPLDATLFSVEPPEGYNSTPFLPVDLNAPPSQFVAEFLKAYANQFGELPKRLQDAPKMLADMVGPPKEDEGPSEESMKLSFYSAAIMAVLTHGKEGVDWQYYPGHALGEKDQMIFWVHDERSGSYSAVLGDLRVEAVTKEQLPPGKSKSE